MEKIKQNIEDFKTVAKLTGVEVPIGSITPDFITHGIISSVPIKTKV